MKKVLFGLSLIMIMVSGCKQAKNENKDAVIDMESRETPDFSKGVMDEKILWYLGRWAMCKCRRTARPCSMP